MPKEQKTAAELAQMIRRHLDQPELRVAIFAKGDSWYAKVYASESEERRLQRRADLATQLLAERFQLYEER
jgi:hypothetical protein